MYQKVLYAVVLILKLFSETLAILSLSPLANELSRSLVSKVVYKASYWDCDDIYIGRQSVGYIIAKPNSCQTSIFADHITLTL